MGLNVQLQQVPNPRVELEEHYYNVVHTKLLDLGLQPHLLNDAEVEHLISIAIAHRIGRARVIESKREPNHPLAQLILPFCDEPKHLVNCLQIIQRKCGFPIRRARRRR